MNGIINSSYFVNVDVFTTTISLLNVKISYALKIKSVQLKDGFKVYKSHCFFASLKMKDRFKLDRVLLVLKSR